MTGFHNNGHSVGACLMTGVDVRRAKAAFSQWVRDPPGHRYSRKLLERQFLRQLRRSPESGECRILAEHGSTVIMTRAMMRIC